MRTTRAVILGASLVLTPLCYAEEQAAGNPLSGIGSALGGIFGSITGAIADAFDPRANQLRDYIARGEYYDAELYYGWNKEHLADPKYEPLLREVAEGLTEKYRADMESALAGLRAVQRPIAPQAEEPAKQAVSRAEVVLDNFRQAPLAGERFRSPLLGDLMQATKDLRVAIASEPVLLALRAIARPTPPGQWRAARQALARAMAASDFQDVKLLHEELVRELTEGAAAAFRDYDHAQPELFFAEYPVDLPTEQRGALVTQHAQAWQAALERSSPEHQQRLAAAYAPQLGEAERPAFVRAYGETVMRTRGLQEPLRLVDLLAVIQQVEKAGLAADEPRQRLRVWVLKAPPGSLPVSLSFPPGQVAGEVAPDQLGAWVKSLARGRPGEVHLLIDPYLRHVRNGLAGVSSQSREFVAGRRDEPNPAWHSAQRELDEARDQLRTTEQQERMMREQMREMSQMNMGNRSRLGANLGAGMVAWGANAARDRVREAEQQLSQTPRMVRKDVIETYRAPVARLELFRKHEVALYIVEPATQRFSRVVLDKSSRESAELVLGVHPGDPGHASVDAENASSQSRLLNLARAPIEVAQDETWAHLLASDPGAGQPLGSLAQAVAADRRQWAQEVARDAAAFREQSSRANAQLKQALSDNQALFRRAAATRHAAIEPEPYARERTTGQALVDVMRDLNDALLDMREQQRSGMGRP